jgi:hypothetical protein
MSTENKIQKEHSAAAPGHNEIILLTGETSPGVKRIEAISKHISFVDRIFLFVGVFLVAYAYGLDGTLRYTYQVNSAKTNFNHNHNTNYLSAARNCKLFTAFIARIYHSSSKCDCSSSSGLPSHTSLI